MGCADNYPIMADETKATPASESGTAAAAPAPKVKVNPVAKLVAKIDEAMKENREKNEKLAKLKGEINSTAEVCKQKKLSDDVTIGIINQIYFRVFPEAAPVRGKGRPKGSVSTKGKARAKRVKKTAALVAKMKKMHKAGSTYEEIKAATGVGVQTIPKWIGKK